MSDRDPKFTGNFWKSLFKGLNTTLNFSTSFHPQTDRQTERVNQVLEDLLRMYGKDQPGKWEDYLHLVALLIIIIIKLQLDLVLSKSCMEGSVTLLSLGVIQWKN